MYLSFHRSIYRACICTSAAVNAGARVDDVVLVALRDRAHGAAALTGTAADAVAADDICQRKHLQFLKTDCILP